MASGGAVEYLFHDLVPGATPVQIIAHGLEKDIPPHSYRNAIVAELNQKIIGMSLSYPARFHHIDDEMRNFIPADRLAHFEDFFAARVDNSYLIDAISVEPEYRRQGVGKMLLEKTSEKAHKQGFSLLSLIVFADNEKAIRLYTEYGFIMVKKIDLAQHALIPHKGGCLLMKAEI